MLVLLSFAVQLLHHTTHLEPRIAPAASVSAWACPHGHRACPGTCRTAAHASTGTCQHKFWCWKLLCLAPSWLVLGCS